MIFEIEEIVLDEVAIIEEIFHQSRKRGIVDYRVVAEPIFRGLFPFNECHFQVLLFLWFDIDLFYTPHFASGVPKQKNCQKFIGQGRTG